MQSIPGWSNIAVFLVSALLGGGPALYYVVERSKKCADFAVTTFFVHLLATWYVRIDTIRVRVRGRGRDRV